MRINERSAKLRVRSVALSAVAGFAIFAAALSPVHAQSGDPKAILKAMSDFLGAQKDISATFDADIEVITPDLQKIQFTNSGAIQVSRPDRLRASRLGGYSAVDMVFDGRTFTTLDRDKNVYAQVSAAGSVDDLLAKFRREFAVTAPGADLIVSDVYDGLMDDVIDAKYIGEGVIDGTECAHLAFRTTDVDWQIWIEKGPRPIPRKYVITSKTIAAAPQYTLRVKEMKTEAQIAADVFAFKPPPGATQVEPAKFPRADELPEGVIMGGSK